MAIKIRNLNMTICERILSNSLLHHSSPNGHRVAIIVVKAIMEALSANNAPNIKDRDRITNSSSSSNSNKIINKNLLKEKKEGDTRTIVLKMAKNTILTMGQSVILSMISLNGNKKSSERWLKSRGIGLLKESNHKMSLSIITDNKHTISKIGMKVR